MKGIVVRLDSPTGNNEDYIYSDTGFFREIQLFEEGECVHKSGGFHPQSIINTHYKGEYYIALTTDNTVYKQIDLP